MKYYLAIDIGASGGRHMLGHMDNGRMRMEEIYRFPNEIQERDGTLCWDIDYIFSEVLAGIKKCAQVGKMPYSLGIDTWGVDFVLLDSKDKRLGPAVSYRDGRTKDMDEAVYGCIPDHELYRKTGIQKQPFNTIYQLMALRKKQPELLRQAESLLMIPDYLNFLLTGVKRQEYTNATTSQLIDPVTKNWNFDLIERLDYPAKIFQEIVTPGTCLGGLRKEIQDVAGCDCRVVLPPTHDTASAVLAVPCREKDALYISSGTWSLMGTERPYADCGEASRLHNFTNEGGHEYRYRYLKNIMGLWMLQSVKREFKELLGQSWAYEDLCAISEKEAISSLVDCNDSRFLSPTQMIAEIQAYCAETGQQIPETATQLARVIYRSLADCYGKTKLEIEELTGKKYHDIYIVGGGSQADYLNRLTAHSCQYRVHAGPAEATAIGNIMAQMLADGVWENVGQARDCVFESFSCKTYEAK